MRTVRWPRRRAIAVAAAALLLATLTGCAPSPISRPTPTPTPHPTPIFSSDKEALAAATKAYAAYIRVSDEIAHDGGAHPERIRAVVSPKWAQREIESFAQFAAHGYRQVGHSAYRDVALQSRNEESGRPQVNIYVCSDASGTRILDANGDDVTPSDRVAVLTFLATFTSVEKQSHQLVLEYYDPWSGSGIC